MKESTPRYETRKLKSVLQTKKQGGAARKGQKKKRGKEIMGERIL